MKRSNWAVALVATAIIGGSSIFAIAADEKKADAKPAAAATEKPAKKAKAIKLTKPWSAISSLSDEQKAKIDEIHKGALEEIKAVQAREKDAIMAVLNDQQKAEVTALTEKETVDKKMKKEGAGKAG